MNRVLFPVMLLVAMGCPSTDRVDDILSLTGDSTTGGEVFDAACSNCHNADGTAFVGPALADEVPESSDESLLDVILNGEGAMPGNSNLADQDLADLLAWLNAEF